MKNKCVLIMITSFRATRRTQITNRKNVSQKNMEQIQGYCWLSRVITFTHSRSYIHSLWLIHLFILSLYVWIFCGCVLFFIFFLVWFFSSFRLLFCLLCFFASSLLFSFISLLFLSLFSCFPFFLFLDLSYRLILSFFYPLPLPFPLS